MKKLMVGLSAIFYMLMLSQANAVNTEPILSTGQDGKMVKTDSIAVKTDSIAKKKVGGKVAPAPTGKVLPVPGGIKPVGVKGYTPEPEKKPKE